MARHVEQDGWLVHERALTEGALVLELGMRKKSDALVEDDLAATQATLAGLLVRPNLLRDVTLERRMGRYTRNLLFGNAGMSVWAMIWAPGSRTSVHDHHCSCCFGILDGTLTEIRYRAINGSEAVERQRLQRRAGFIHCLLPNGPNIHSMANESDREAISIHIYGYDHRLRASSVEREYRVVAG